MTKSAQKSKAQIHIIDVTTSITQLLWTDLGQLEWQMSHNRRGKLVYGCQPRHFKQQSCNQKYTNLKFCKKLSRWDQNIKRFTRLGFPLVSAIPCIMEHIGRILTSFRQGFHNTLEMVIWGNKQGLLQCQGRRRRGGAGGHVAPPPLSKVGGHKWVCAPPPLLGRANVLISLFAHILRLKTHFFFKIFLARFARQLL